MPQSAGEIFGYLCGEVLSTRAKWINFRHLYMDHKHRCRKLRNAGAHFFNELRYILGSDLILSLARLTDPAETFGKRNVTLAQLVVQLESDVAASSLVNSLRVKIPEVEAAVKELRVYRKKLVAHYDHGVVVSRVPIKAVTYIQIRQAIEAIEAFLGEVMFHYTGGSFMWELPSNRHDADVLYERLCKAEAYDELEGLSALPSGLWRKYDA